MKSNFGTLLKIKINTTYTDIYGVFVVPPIETEQERSKSLIMIRTALIGNTFRPG